MNKKHLARIASKGAIARIRKYGNPGTPEGRRLGGLNSLLTHRRKGTLFKTLRRIKRPRPSARLAELIGIFMGDGSINKYQASVTTNSKTDFLHAQFVLELCNRLFSISGTLIFRRGKNACAVIISSKEVCRFLAEQGMPQGSKVRDGVRVPLWIEENPEYRRAFIRGLFDTDGSVYVDVHRHKNRNYKNIGMVFTNRCPPLISSFFDTLRYEGLHPTQKSKFSVFLRREKEIQQYFDVIGTSNPKHRQRFYEFSFSRN